MENSKEELKKSLKLLRKSIENSNEVYHDPNTSEQQKSEIMEVMKLIDIELKDIMKDIKNNENMNE